MGAFNAGKAIGPHFMEEIGGLSDRRFAWGPDGNFTVSDNMSDVNLATLKAVVAAHDPAKAASPSQRDIDAIDLRAKIDALVDDVVIPKKVRDFVAALKKVL